MTDITHGIDEVSRPQQVVLWVTSGDKCDAQAIKLNAYLKCGWKVIQSHYHSVPASQIKTGYYDPKSTAMFVLEGNITNIPEEYPPYE